MDVLGLEDSPNGDRNVVYDEFSKQRKRSPEGWYETGGAINSTNIQTVRPGKEDHLKRWTCFFETFPVGPIRSIEFWTKISGNFG